MSATNTLAREVIGQLKYVRIVKVAEAETPAHVAGDLNSYQLGLVNPGVSIPTSYSMCGWLLAQPSIGAGVVLLRCSRNGVLMPGIFMSTDVIAILGKREFHTINSKYVWDEIAAEEGGSGQ